MKNKITGWLLFGAVAIIGIMVGGYILSAIFFGTITLLGLVVIIESIPPFRWIASRTSAVIDVLIFVFTIMAIANYGLNLTASLTVAGLGYTLLYAPHLRSERKKQREHRKKHGRRRPFRNYIEKFDRR